MRKGILSAMVALGLVATSATAMAGFTANQPVLVNPFLRVAQGALGSARNSPDNIQFIGCAVTDGAGGAFVTCSARGPGGNFATCTSSDPGKVAAASSINSDSFVVFRYDAQGNCTLLSVSTFSQYPTKAH